MSDDLTQQTDQMKAAFLVAEVELASRQGRIVDPQAMFEEWDSWLNRIRAEAKKEAYMDAQQIIAGDQMIDEARERKGDMTSIAGAIKEIDAEMREMWRRGDD